MIPFSLFEVDGVDFRTDASPASGDAKIMKDEGALTTTTRAFVDEGQTYSISLTTTERDGSSSAGAAEAMRAGRQRAAMRAAMPRSLPWFGTWDLPWQDAG